MLSVLAGCVDDKTIDESVDIDADNKRISITARMIVVTILGSPGLLKMTRVICPTFGMLILRLPVMKQTH